MPCLQRWQGDMSVFHNPPTNLPTDILIVVLGSSLAVIYVVSFQRIVEGVITHITTKLPQQQSAAEALHFFIFAVNTRNISHMPGPVVGSQNSAANSLAWFLPPWSVHSRRFNSY